jgi:hypothetical protein
MLLIIIFLFNFRVFLSNSSHDCILMQILLTTLYQCPARVKTSLVIFEEAALKSCTGSQALQAATWPILVAFPKY